MDQLLRLCFFHPDWKQRSQPTSGVILCSAVFECQSHALSTISRRDDFLGVQPSMSAAARFSATNTGGSPGRRSASRQETLRLLTCSTIFTTCLIEYPRPLPRLNALLAPSLRRYSRASRWAEARSST